MKILFISEHYYPEHFTSTLLAEYFASKGNEVTVLSKDSNEIHHDISVENHNNVNIVRLPCYLRKNNNKKDIIKDYLSFWNQSKIWVNNVNTKFDVVFTFATSPVINISAGNIYAKRNNVKHYAYVLDLWPESVLATGYSNKLSLTYLFLKIWSKKIYKDSKNIIIGSPSYRDYFKNILKLSNLNIEYVPQPAFSPIINKSETNLPKGKINIVYFGNITKWQKIDMLIPLAKRLEDKNILIYIFGNGSYKNEFVNMVHSNNISNISIHDVVSQDELSSYVNHSDFIYVSLTDKGYVGKTIPQKLIQAFSYGKPVIGFINGDGKDLIDKYNCGFTSSGFSLDDLVSLFERAIDSTSNDRKKLGQNSLICYKENFDIEIVGNKILSIFSK